jgi:hypothetical protein
MAREAFQYAVIRVVPCVEREEFLNVGVIVFCRTRRYLAARVELDEARLAALAPGRAWPGLREHLDARVRVAAGDPDAGPIAALPQSERFHWLVAPSSTTIQSSAAHSGLCEEPATMLDHLMRRLVHHRGRASRCTGPASASGSDPSRFTAS